MRELVTIVAVEEDSAARGKSDFEIVERDRSIELNTFVHGFLRGFMRKWIASRAIISHTALRCIRSCRSLQPSSDPLRLWPA